MKTFYRVKVEADDDPMNPRTDQDNLGTMFCWHHGYHLGDHETRRPDRGPNHWRNPKCDLYVDDGPEATLLKMIGDVDSKFEGRLNDWHEREYDRRGIAGKLDKEFDGALRELHRDQAELIQRKIDKFYVTLPLYLYDHSGITMNTSGFSCRWDSGQVGFIWMSRKTANENLGYAEFKDKTGWTAAKEARVVEHLKNEVKTYDQFLTGDVYGYTYQKLVYEFEHPVEDVDVDADNDDLPWDDDESCWGFFGDDVEASGICDGVDPVPIAVMKEAQDDLGEWKLYIHDDATVAVWKPETDQKGTP